MRTVPYTTEEIRLLKDSGKYKKDNPETQRLRGIRHRWRNPKTNAVSRMVYKDAGSYMDFYDLPKSERLRLRMIAGKKYDKIVPFKRESLKDIIYNIAPPSNWTRTKRLLPEIDRPKSKRVTTMQVNDPRGFVYIFKDHMKDEGFYKIGSSYKVKDRLDQADTWGDFESIYESEEVSDCARLEKEVHQSLRKYQVKGEWFRADIDLIINKIEEIVDAGKEQEMGKQKVS